MIIKGLFSSEHQAWETPPEMFDELNRVFHFTLDVCAHEGNHKLDNYFSINCGSS